MPVDVILNYCTYSKFSVDIPARSPCCVFDNRLPNCKLNFLQTIDAKKENTSLGGWVSSYSLTFANIDYFSIYPRSGYRGSDLPADTKEFQWVVI